VVTEQHAALIEQLDSASPTGWGERALLACLTRLRDGGPTEASIVEVYEAWPVDDGFKIVYLSPWGPRVGLTARLGAMQFFMNIYADSLKSEPTPEEFGKEIADFFVAEPLGGYVDILEYDAEGLGWWGERRLT
jgi:hypothetical protein